MTQLIIFGSLAKRYVVEHHSFVRSEVPFLARPAPGAVNTPGEGISTCHSNFTGHQMNNSAQAAPCMSQKVATHETVLPALTLIRLFCLTAVVPGPLLGSTVTVPLCRLARVQNCSRTRCTHVLANQLPAGQFRPASRLGPVTKRNVQLAYILFSFPDQSFHFHYLFL